MIFLDAGRRRIAWDTRLPTFPRVREAGTLLLSALPTLWNKTMDATKQFLAYAAAFEQSLADDDWTRLEPFFALDATYSVAGGPPLGGRWEGREGVLAQLRESVHQLDRRFDARRVEVLGAPVADAGSFEMTWRATYEKVGCPDLIIGGIERAKFEGGLIRELEDEMEDGVDQRIQDFMARYFV